VIVAVSINLSRILAIKTLTGRAGEALLYLGSAMIAASFGLLPQPMQLLRIELIILGAAVRLLTFTIQINAMRQPGEARLIIRIVFALACLGPLLAAGVLFYLGEPFAPFVLAGGILASLAVGLTHTWVLLVEIPR
jgi:hypothetical protein